MNLENTDELGLHELFCRVPRFVVCEDGRDVQISEEDMRIAVDRLCGGLQKWGINPGDRIAVWLPNGLPYLSLLWAAARLGVVVVSINTRFRSSEVQDIVGRSGARLLVMDPSFLGIDFRGILAQIDNDELGIEAIVSLAGDVDGPWETVSWAELSDALPSDVDRCDPDLPWIVFTTSGTTSAPKLVLHCQGSPAAHARDLERWVGPSVLAAVPFCGVFGYTMLLGAMGRGSELITMPVFDASLAASAIERYGVTTFHGSDEMLMRIVESGRDLTSLEAVGYARFNNALEGVVDAAARVGVKAIGLYGMSEVHALYAHRSIMASGSAEVPGGELVSPRARARVVDPANGKDVELGGEGELLLQGPSMFAGYLADGGDRIDEELTAQHFTRGWFKTGDLARLENDRTFEYLARLGDVLRLGGFLVNPAEIEDCILKDVDVESVQVVGVDLPAGPKAVAFVVAKSQVSEDAIRMRCRQELAAYKVPIRVFQIDEFPTTSSANGVKIQKTRLRDIALLEIT